MKDLHTRVEAGLAQAKAALDNPNSTQEGVDAQVKVMQELTEEVTEALAGDSLIQKDSQPSAFQIKDLQDLLNEVDKLDESRYTKDSLRKLAEKVSKAQEVLSHATTQTEIDEVYKSVISFKNSGLKLEKKPVLLTNSVEKEGEKPTSVMTTTPMARIRPSVSLGGSGFRAAPGYSYEITKGTLSDLVAGQYLNRNVMIKLKTPSKSDRNQQVTTFPNIGPRLEYANINRDGQKPYPSETEVNYVLVGNIPDEMVGSYHLQIQRYDHHKVIIDIPITVKPKKPTVTVENLATVAGRTGIIRSTALNSGESKVTFYVNGIEKTIVSAVDGVATWNTPDILNKGDRITAKNTAKANLSTRDAYGNSIVVSAADSDVSDEVVIPENKIDREQANHALDQAKRAQDQQLTANPKLSDSEKNKAKEEVQRAFDTAKEAIKTARDQNGVDTAKATGVTNIRNVNPVGRELANEALDQAKRVQYQQLTANPKLSYSEKSRAKEEVQRAFDTAKEAIKTASDQNGVDMAMTTGVTNIRNVNPVGRELASHTLDQAKRAQYQKLTANLKLSDSEKSKAKEEVQREFDTAKEVIKTASDQNGVDMAMTTGVTNIRNVNPVGRELANDALDQAKRAQDQQLTVNPKLSDSEKSKSKEEVQKVFDTAKEAIKTASDQNGVDTAKATGVTNIRNVNPVGRELANHALDKKANDKKNSINDNQKLSDNEKKAAIIKVDEEVEKAKKAIQDGQDQTAVDTARRYGETAIDAINPQPAPRPIPIPTPVPSPSASTQPLQPMETGDSQIPSASATPQEGSETPVISSDRSRRSVGFVGGTPSSDSKSVDKSELRKLVQDLEALLKVVDDVDRSVIAAAKVVLADAQVALKNKDLTAHELADILTRVRNALKSLQGVKSTEKSETLSNSEKKGESDKDNHSKETPLYGVFGVVVLSLLGALLFVLARKKTSQLDKLLRELSQLIAELEAGVKDQNGLNQAKQLVEEASDFVTSQQKDTQKEAELISKIKTSIATLKEKI